MRSYTRRPGQGGGVRGRAAVLAGTAVLTLALGGCGESAPRAQDAGPRSGMQLTDGEWVTLRGEVQRVLGPHSFTVRDGERDTLVYGARSQRVCA